MKKQTLRRFAQDAFTPGGIKKELSNRTPIHRSASMIPLCCAVCGISFLRKASEAKRNATHYCGVGCRGVAQRKQTTTKCKQCGKEFFVKNSALGRVTCCSDTCRSALVSTQVTQRDKEQWATGVFAVGKSAARKLTLEKVRLILSSSDSSYSLAKQLAVSKRAVMDVRQKKSWRHVV